MKAPEGQEFYFSDGRVAGSLAEFVAHVKDISPDVFNAHVNEGKNDFHAWLKHSLSSDAAHIIEGALQHREIVEKLEGHQWEQEHKEKFGY
ncbi:MAG: hypothetical protein ACOC32_00950 [Nanoarchaeota archaeon]